MISPEQQRAHRRHIAFHASLRTLALPKPPSATPKSVQRDILWVAAPMEAPPDRPAPEIPAIIRAVCKKYGVKRATMMGRRRCARIIWPRHVAIYLAYELTPRCVSVIGRAFDNRDFKTVSNSIDRVLARIASDPAFASEIDKLARMVE